MKLFASIAMIVATGLSACGSTGADYRPIVDGSTTARYHADLSACQNLAQQRGYLNDDVKTHAIGGAVLGGVLGGLEDGLGGAIAGGLVGSVAGAGKRAWETQDERKSVVVNCMGGRGHRVVG